MVGQLGGREGRVVGRPVGRAIGPSVDRVCASKFEFLASNMALLKTCIKHSKSVMLGTFDWPRILMSSVACNF